MNHLNDLPPWMAILIATFLIIGSTLALLGSVGLVRLRSYYQRLHAPTLSYSYGTLMTILSSILMFSYLETRPVVHELVIGVFVMITAPITLLMLGRAALRRDQDAKLAHEEPVPARETLRASPAGKLIRDVKRSGHPEPSPDQPGP